MLEERLKEEQENTKCIYSALYRIVFPEKYKKSIENWTVKNVEYVKEKHRQNARKGMRERNLKKYGITQLEYETLFKKQHGLCAICLQPETFKQRNKIQRLAVDHCHKTNLIRGLLCRQCNLTIGFIRDNIELLERTINYLKLCH